MFGIPRKEHVRDRAMSYAVMKHYGGRSKMFSAAKKNPSGGFSVSVPKEAIPVFQNEYSRLRRRHDSEVNKIMMICASSFFLVFGMIILLIII